jgi:hypothetical protein
MAKVNLDYNQLECGPCGFIVTVDNTLDRQLLMQTHWHVCHANLMPPVFDQNTWRTQVVKELTYSSNIELPPQRTVEVPTATKQQQKVQILVREVRDSDRRVKVRYQVYVRLPHKPNSIYFPHTDTIDNVRAQRNALYNILVHAIPGDTKIEVLDFLD